MSDEPGRQVACFISKAQVEAAGLDPRTLRITVAEARSIDKCLIDGSRRKASRCSRSVDRDCGAAVLVSLVHWCGESGLIRGEQCPFSCQEHYCVYIAFEGVNSRDSCVTTTNRW